MNHYLIAALLTWLPLTVLTLSLTLRGKAHWPLSSGILEPGILCMDGRLKGRGWRLPGGAYAVGFPVFWGTVGVSVFFLGAPDPILQFVVAAFTFQFSFAQPLQDVALFKIFLHALLGDSESFSLELHHHICKAVMFVDPLALLASPLYYVGEHLGGGDIFEKIFDAITSIHLIDVVPLLVAGSVVAVVGRALRKTFINRSSPWLKLRLRFSDFHEEVKH